jgi:hypothetical protein
MPNPNQCEHKWSGGQQLWIVATAFGDHPNDVLKRDGKTGYIAIERCINCGIMRFPEDFHGKDAIAFGT